jgi:hypothetical protein
VIGHFTPAETQIGEIFADPTLLFMVPALIALIGVAIATAGQLVGQFISARNDRALAHQEVDLLKKLQPGSQAAADLEIVIRTRIGKWRGRHEKRRVAQTRFWMRIAGAYAALTLGLLLLFYVKPEARGELPTLARGAIYFLLVLAGLQVLAAIGWFLRLAVLAVKGKRETGVELDDAAQTASSDPSPAATGPAPSPNGSSDHATPSASPEARPDPAAARSAVKGV